jgi:hypothetical protein
MYPVVQAHVILAVPIMVPKQEDEEQNQRYEHESLPGDFMK